MVETTVEGTPIRFFVGNPQDAIQKYHYEGRFYEAEELAIIRRHWTAGQLFVDVGANVGNHAVYVDRFLPGARTLVIEPNPDAIAILRLNLALNACTGVDTRHLGIALGNGERRLAIRLNDPDNLGGAWLGEAGDASIPVVRGDTLLGAERPGFIKVDVEGMELEVLEGLAQTIAQARPTMFVEVLERNAQSFFAWCDRFGYRIAVRYQRYEAITNFLVVPQ